MSMYTADEVEIYIEKLRDTNISPIIGEMLEDLARRLRQEEEENRRDPVHCPKVGDAIWIGGHPAYIYSGQDQWHELCKTKGATIIRRREVQ